MNENHASWLLLIVSLPTNSATARMRIWRNLKALGCGLLRDGAYLLPDTGNHREPLQALCNETQAEGGIAWLLTIASLAKADEEAFRGLFERDGEYAEFAVICNEARKQISNLSPPEINKQLRKLRREFEAIRAIDYFPNESSREAEAMFMDFVAAAEVRLSPDEPHTIKGGISSLAIGDYQGRTWATRKHLWVDRVACAWLIKRFIDQHPKFIWLDAPSSCPTDALGFDFDGATFTHIGDRVSFEVLLASFGLEQDQGLARLGSLIHTLDIGEGYVPEANGFEAMLAGARQRLSDDDQFLAEVSLVLDSLYAHFSKDQQSKSAL
jgi:hypothetical protein